MSMAAVVLVHGLSGSARSWARNLAELSRELDVRAVDLLAVVRPFRLAEAADRLTDWMDAQGLARASLIGHSMGGAVALDLAARFPARVERLVLVAAAMRPVPAGQRARGMLVAGWREPPSLAPQLAFDALRTGPVGLWRATRAVLALDLTARAAEVHAPTLVVWGERDPLVPLGAGRDLTAALPNARLAIVADAGHNPMWERPDAFNRLVLDFLVPRS